MQRAPAADPTRIRAAHAGLRVETVIGAPDADQYAGSGQAAGDIAGIAASARQLEALGFDTLTAPEAGHDPFLPLLAAAEHTREIALGTNVAIAFPRSPMVTAQLAWDLQRLSGGRFQLGLGSQVRSHIERRYAGDWTAPAATRMREYVACLRAIFQAFQLGKRPAFEGAHYRCTLLPPFFSPGPIANPHVPIHLAVVNPAMARLAGEHCDGLRLHPIATFHYTREVVLPAVAAGAQRAGRDPSEIEVIGAPFLAIADGAEAIRDARQALKQRIAFYASTPTYHAVLAHHGWEDLGRHLHALSREGRWGEMAGAIGDEMLQEWAIIGGRDELAGRLRERCGDLYSSVLLDLSPALRSDPDWVGETVDALHGAAP